MSTRLGCLEWMRRFLDTGGWKTHGHTTRESIGLFCDLQGDILFGITNLARHLCDAGALKAMPLILKRNRSQK